MLLHSPIRDVYLCIQGFDSRLACRICNNTVQSSIRADGPSAHRERRRWRECDKERKKRGQREEAQERKKEVREKQAGEKERHRRQERGNCRKTMRMIPV